MKYEERRIIEIPCISFMKGSRFNLYVGPRLSWFQRRRLRKVQGKYKVLYLPEIFKKLNAEQLNYNFPGFKLPEDCTADSVYEMIREAAGGEMKTGCRYFLRYDGEAFVFFVGATGSFALALEYLAAKGASFKRERKVCSRKARIVGELKIVEHPKIVEINEDKVVVFDDASDPFAPIEERTLENDSRSDIEEEANEDIRFSVRPAEESENNGGGIRFSVKTDEDAERQRKSAIYARMAEYLDYLEEPPIPTFPGTAGTTPKPTPKPKPKPQPKTSDAAFEKAMKKAVEDVRDAINALLMTGFPVDILQAWLSEKVQLSRLRITRQYKILLVDYDMEVKMGPLPKTVFLFYLRHPEGVRFSYLQDHADELREIYGQVSVNDDPQKMEESINALIDPFNNSICEKCAAIKRAFVLQVKDNIAKNYYVTGTQGGEKCISLDRTLVEWECEL